MTLRSNVTAVLHKRRQACVICFPELLAVQAAPITLNISAPFAGMLAGDERHAGGNDEHRSTLPVTQRMSAKSADPGSPLTNINS